MSWTGDIGAMGKLAQRIADLASVPSRAARRVSSSLAQLIDDEFDAGADPYGTAWKPLAQSTQDKGRTPPPLTDTGAMRRGVRVAPMRGSGVSITIPHPGAPHQTGWKGPRGSGPARPILPTRQMPELWKEAIEAAAAIEFKETA